MMMKSSYNEKIDFLMSNRGDYQVIKSDQVAYRYEIIEMLGRGSFGQVKN